MTRSTLATGRNLIIAVVLAVAALASLMAVQGFAINSDDGEVQARGVIVSDDLKYAPPLFYKGIIVGYSIN
jgi:hypothetical protein